MTSSCRRRFSLRLCAAILCLQAAALVHGGEPTEAIPVLVADFDDQVLDQPIGTNGPEFGQPYFSDVDNRIVQGVLSGRSLRVVDTRDDAAERLQFQFLDQAQVTSGTLWFRWLLMVEEYGEMEISIRQRHLAAANYGTLTISALGALWVTDDNGTTALAANGTVRLDTPLQFDWVFDQDNQTHSIYLEGDPLVEGRTHDVAAGAPGIGRITVGFPWPANGMGTFHLDALEVVHSVPVGPPPGPAIFADGFELLAPPN